MDKDLKKVMATGVLLENEKPHASADVIRRMSTFEKRLLTERMIALAKADRKYRVDAEEKERGRMRVMAPGVASAISALREVQRETKYRNIARQEEAAARARARAASEEREAAGVARSRSGSPVRAAAGAATGGASSIPDWIRALRPGDPVNFGTRFQIAQRTVDNGYIMKTNKTGSIVVGDTDNRRLPKRLTFEVVGDDLVRREAGRGAGDELLISAVLYKPLSEIKGIVASSTHGREGNGLANLRDYEASGNEMLRERYAKY